MRNTLLLQSKQIKVFISTLILLCLCSFQNTAWSETNIATATDEGDAIVAGKLFKSNKLKLLQLK